MEKRKINLYQGKGAQRNCRPDLEVPRSRDFTPVDVHSESEIKKRDTFWSESKVLVESLNQRTRGGKGTNQVSIEKKNVFGGTKDQGVGPPGRGGFDEKKMGGRGAFEKGHPPPSLKGVTEKRRRCALWTRRNGMLNGNQGIF